MNKEILCVGSKRCWGKTI